MFHSRKTRPEATPMTLATTMSTTRQRYGFAGGDAGACVDDDADVDACNVFSSLRRHDPDQVRRSKRGSLPLSPAHRTPVVVGTSIRRLARYLERVTLDDAP